MTQRRAKRTYSEEQKKQLVELFNHGKPRSEIVREYDLTASAFDKWENSNLWASFVSTKKFRKWGNGGDGMDDI